MDEKTSSAPMQEDPQKGEELSFTITGEDAEAQDALNAEKPEPQQKKKSPLPWILGAAAVIIAAALVLILTIKPSQTTPDADQPGDATISEPADTPDDAQPDDQTPAAEDETNGQTGEEDTQTGGNGVSYTVDAEALTDEVLDLEVAQLRRRPADEPGSAVLLLAAVLFLRQHLQLLRRLSHRHHQAL